MNSDPPSTWMPLILERSGGDELVVAKVFGAGGIVGGDVAKGPFGDRVVGGEGLEGPVGTRVDKQRVDFSRSSSPGFLALRPLARRWA